MQWISKCQDVSKGQDLLIVPPLSWPSHWLMKHPPRCEIKKRWYIRRQVLVSHPWYWGPYHLSFPEWASPTSCSCGLTIIKSYSLTIAISDCRWSRMYLMYQNVLRDSGKSDDMRCFFVVFLGGGVGGILLSGGIWLWGMYCRDTQLNKLKPLDPFVEASITAIILRWRQIRCVKYQNWPSVTSSPAFRAICSGSDSQPSHISSSLPKSVPHWAPSTKKSLSFPIFT